MITNIKKIKRNKYLVSFFIGFLFIFIFLLTKLKVWGWQYNHIITHGSHIRYIFPFFILLFLLTTPYLKLKTFIKTLIVYLSIIISFYILFNGNRLYSIGDIYKLNYVSSEINEIITNYSQNNNIIFTEIIEVFDYKNKNIINIKHIPENIRESEIQRISNDKNFTYYIILLNNDWLKNFNKVNYEFIEEKNIYLDKIIWGFKIYKINPM